MSLPRCSTSFLPSLFQASYACPRPLLHPSLFLGLQWLGQASGQVGLVLEGFFWPGVDGVRNAPFGQFLLSSFLG